jgi:hypothetical protein
LSLKLDVAEANLHEALGNEHPRRRDAVSMFFLRHMQRAAKQGYAVAALGVEAYAEPARFRPSIALVFAQQSAPMIHSLGGSTDAAPRDKRRFAVLC